SWPPFAGPAMTCAQRSWHSASEIRLDRGRLIAVQITLQRKGHGRNLELDAGCDRITRCIITLTALQFAAMSLLEKINSPADLRRLRLDELQTVADEIRQYILETMSRVGGHTGASLGAIELAVALHYAFDTPHDRLVWDVGHQAYAHKILTGRRDQLPTVKQYGGLLP